MPKQAMKDREYNAVEFAIRTLFDRMVTAKDPRFTLDDVTALFVPPEHMDMARKVVTVMQMSTSGNLDAYVPFEGRPMKRQRVEIRFKGADWYWPERYGRDPDGWATCPDEVKEKLLSWVKWRAELGYEWSKVSATLQALQEHCTNIDQMRFYWPALPALMDMQSTSRDTAAKMREFRFPKTLPSLPTGLQQACTDTMATITKGLLFPADKKYERPVNLTMYEIYRVFGSRDLPWGRSYSCW